LYVLGCNDPGVEELAEYFGRDGWRLRRQPNVTMRVLEGADHTLGSHTLRAALIEDIRNWCRDNWLMRDSTIQPTAAPQAHIQCEPIARASGTAPLQTAGPARTVVREHYRDWTSTASRS
jgi:hypothetical protein